MRPGWVTAPGATWTARSSSPTPSPPTEAAGVEGEWVDASFGHGRAYRFTGPGGHTARAVLGRRSRGRAARRGVAVPRAGRSAPARTASACASSTTSRSRRRTCRRACDVVHQDVLGFRDHGRRSRPSPGAPWFLGVVSHEREVPRPRVHPGLRRAARAACTTSRSGWRPTTTSPQGATFLIEHGARHRLRPRAARHRGAELPVLPRSGRACATSSTRAATATTCPIGSR